MYLDILRAYVRSSSYGMSIAVSVSRFFFHQPFFFFFFFFFFNTKSQKVRKGHARPLEGGNVVDGTASSSFLV